jgi:uncharacterized protein
VSDPSGPVLSVRGDARQAVAPDSAELDGVLSSSRPAKADAVRAVAGELDRLTADLSALGGVALTPETGRAPLTWSAHSATTHPEQAEDETTGRYEPTGRIAAAVAVAITVRTFDLLDALGAVLARHDALSIHHVSWDVDWDNPGWPAVRAAAIAAAIRKGRDYAAALGGSLDRIEHVADVGLLGGTDGTTRFVASSAGGRASRALRGGGEGDAPSLDPVPQELTATIEARFTAAGVSLPAL